MQHSHTAPNAPALHPVHTGTHGANAPDAPPPYQGVHRVHGCDGTTVQP